MKTYINAVYEAAGEDEFSISYRKMDKIMKLATANRTYELDMDTIKDLCADLNDICHMMERAKG